MISLVIPAYNEEKRLKNSLEKLTAFLETFPKETEVIVVDDGSTDKTVEVAQNFQNKFKNFRVIKLEQNLGKGAAVNQGFKEANGEIVVFTDADFSTPIEEISKLLKPIEEGFDVVVGSRALDRSLVKKHQKPLRELVGKFSNILIRILAVKGIYDTQCGFKAFKKEACQSVFKNQTVNGFAFDIELLFLAQRMGLRVKEVPVLWFNDPLSKVSTFRDTLNSFLDLIKIRLRHAKKGSSGLDNIFSLLYRYQTFVRFALVGFTGTVVDYTSYYFLTRFLGLTPLQANPISVELAIIWNFTLNNLWTFSRRQTQSISRKFLTFQLVSLGGLMLSQTQILIYTHYINIYDLLSKALTIPLVALFNYIINNRWTFRDQTAEKPFPKVYPFIILLLFIIYLLLVKELTGSFNLFLDRR